MSRQWWVEAEVEALCSPYMMPKSAIMALRNLGVTLKRSARGPAFTS